MSNAKMPGEVESTATSVAGAYLERLPTQWTEFRRYFVRRRITRAERLRYFAKQPLEAVVEYPEDMPVFPELGELLGDEFFVCCHGESEATEE